MLGLFYRIYISLVCIKVIPMARVKRKSKSKARKSRSRSRSSALPSYGTKAFYRAIGKMGAKAPRSNKYPYPDVKRAGGKRKNCFLRRYSNRKHKYYVPKNMYYRSCGFQTDGTGYSAKRRSTFRKDMIDYYNIKKKNPNYQDFARAFRASSKRYGGMNK